jgi:predicted metal-dependent hydrolase
VAIFIAQLALPRMKTAKLASQIKRFIRLFGAHASENTPGFFFRHCLNVE